jgi:hypothetical protein
VRNGEWQLELEAPLAGANWARPGGPGVPRGAGPGPTPAMAAAMAVHTPAASSSTGPEPYWAGSRGAGSGGSGKGPARNDFPGLSGQGGGRGAGGGGVALGNWGKAATAKKTSTRPQVIKPNAAGKKPSAAVAASSNAAVHPKDMKMSPTASSFAPAPAPAPAAPKAKPAADAAKDTQHKAQPDSGVPSGGGGGWSPAGPPAGGAAAGGQSRTQAGAGAEPDYPPLSASSSAAARPASASASKPSNKTSIAMDDYPSLPRPPMPQKAAAALRSDKAAYPPLPVSAPGGKAKKSPAVPASAPAPNAYSGLSSAIASSAAAAASAGALSAAPPPPAPAPVAKKAPPAFNGNTVGDDSEYPSLPASRKKGSRHQIPATTDEAASAFRAIRASVMGVPQPAARPAPAPAYGSSGGSSGGGSGSGGSGRGGSAAAVLSSDDYPVLSNFRIGIARPIDSGGGKQAPPKLSLKKQQKQDLRNMAFNMK